MEGVLYQNLFESIFKNTSNPLILEKLKRVNINWRKPIDQIFETTDIWKSACLNEIPSEPITRMITRLFPTVHFENYHQLEDPILWRSLYFSYRKSMILSKLQFSTQVSHDFSEVLGSDHYISSYAICDEYFAVGSSRGIINVFEINQLNKIVCTVDFKYLVKDIKFWFSDTDDLFLVAIISPFNIKFWNLPVMIEVPCIGNTMGSSICSGTIDRLFIMNYGSLYEYKHTDEGITAYQIMDRLEESFHFINLVSENNKIIIVAEDLSVMTLLYYRLPKPDEGNHLIEEDRRSYNDARPSTSFNYVPPIYFFLTFNVILRVLSENKSSLIFYDPRSKWSLHYPFEKLGSKNAVTSGILHGKLLILGFKSGHVRIFTVENIELLKKSNLNLESGTEYQVADKSIEWLELFETREKLIIIAITNYKVYSINFFPKNSTQ